MGAPPRREGEEDGEEYGQWSGAHIPVVQPLAGGESELNPLTVMATAVRRCLLSGGSTVVRG